MRHVKGVKIAMTFEQKRDDVITAMNNGRFRGPDRSGRYHMVLDAHSVARQVLAYLKVRGQYISWQHKFYASKALFDRRHFIERLWVWYCSGDGKVYVSYKPGVYLR